MNTPPSLNLVAHAWREFFETIPVKVTKNLDNHVKGRHSVYVQEILLKYSEGEKKFYYVGRSSRPARRANEHKHELRRCKTTTFVGKSIIYTPEIAQGVLEVHMHLWVHTGDMDLETANAKEKSLSDELTRDFGDMVLTRPR